MAYLYDLHQLASMGKPPVAGDSRYDYIGDHINLALVESIRALVTEMVELNLNLGELKTINTKLDALIQATKGSTPI